MLEQERISRYFSGYPSQEISAEIEIPMIADSSSEMSFTQTQFPYIAIVDFTSGSRAVIRGTRIPVSIVISYLLRGETPRTLVEKILPNVTLAQVRDAILYYSAHRSEIDKERRENNEDAGRKFLRESLGDDKYNSITGA